MRIFPEADDAPEFVEQVDRAVNTILSRYLPVTLVVIKIDNWFGKRWLGFSGKFMSIAGFTLKTHSSATNHISIPPFVPERVALQRGFNAPTFEEVDAGGRFTRRWRARMPFAGKQRLRFARLPLRGTAAIPRQTAEALMVYLPIDASYWCWYVGLENATTWRVTECWGIKREEYASLIEEGSKRRASVK